MPEYLSTDPNAGLPQYLSTDPNAGLAPSAPAPAASPFGSGSLSERWEAAAPRREAAVGGISKSLLNTLTGVWDLMNMGPRDVAPGAFPGPQRTLTDLIMEREAQAPPRPMTAREILQPDPSNPSAPTIVPTEAEQPFYSAGNIAQYMAPVPGGLIAQAGQSGLLTMLQGGTGREAAISAATAGLVPPVINRASGALRGAAVTQYERALGATGATAKEAAARVAPEAIERGVTGGLGSIAARGAKESDEVGTVIRETYDAATQRGVTVSTAPATARLDALRAKYVTQGRAGDVITNPTAVARIDTIRKMLDDIGPTATPNQLWQVRKNLDEIIGPNGFGQGLSKGTAKKIEKAARTGLQGELDKADPAIKELNRNYGFWEDLEKVSTSTQRRRTSQEMPLSTLLGGAFGAGTGFVQGGGDFSDAAVGGLTAGLLARGAKTPYARTNMAVGVDRFAGGLDASASPIAQLLAALFGGAAGTPGPNPPPAR